MRMRKLSVRSSLHTAVVLGLRPSIGLGDRLGLAIPGIFGRWRAQASAGTRTAICRELERTMRETEAVMDAATWRSSGGLPEDSARMQTTSRRRRISIVMPAGFTMYTLDVGAYVVNEAMHLRSRKCGTVHCSSLGRSERHLEGLLAGMRAADHDRIRPDAVSLGRRSPPSSSEIRGRNRPGGTTLPPSEGPLERARP